MSASLVKPRLRGADPYRAPQRDEPDELMLDLNEGSPLASDDWMAGVAGAVGSDRARRYPDPSALEAKLADRFGIDRECVLATNGGDDAIDRVCRVCMDPGDSIVLPSPTFEMIARSADLVGGEIRRPPWMGGPFPVEQVIDSCDESTRCVAVVSPNNPTGAVIRPDELARLSEAIPRILLMVDLAYTEFAGFDLTQTALDLPNAVMVRTFS
ncbi:MAG: aminotransferase class I/II-fold pyridoxal phosphate-dependent enzyme, partial [Planctomycetota bacterium]